MLMFHKTCITSLVAKRSSQLTHTTVFLNLSKMQFNLVNEREQVAQFTWRGVVLHSISVRVY